MNKITLKNMKFYGYHGVFEFEKKDGQAFEVDVEMTFDIEKAILSDSVDDTVDYSKIFDIVKEITQKHKYNLIEKLANVIVDKIIEKYIQIQYVTVRVRKPNAPLEGEFEYVEVEINRKNIKF